ncbi:DUF630 family protein [Actinidia rufa]|uniref:DUF630 family protein n=1 Tax=Actinidia rufa TaxID=165716 RepID=A0A7J0E2P5_9ERIC|nr:DUF630 family protein [Actinidia rufa]
MGCSTSKLDNEEAVQLCKDRKKFIKQAVEHQMQFASGHVAYIQSLKRVSAALRDYVEGDEPREFLLDSFINPPFTPVKETNAGGNNPSVAVEERPPHSPETVRIETSNFPPPSPQTSQWDFFWNPFSSLDHYGYHTRNSLDHTVLDDEMIRLRQEEVIVEDVDDDDNDNRTDSGTETEMEYEKEGLKLHGSKSMEVSKAQKAGQASNQETALGDRGGDNKETPGFMVYVNRRPTSMAEVIKDLEAQFKIVCDAANKVSDMLEANTAQYASTSNELTAAKMLNPVALIRSASSRSSSSRFLMNVSSSLDEGDDSSSSFSEESCLFSGSHRSTLDRLYAWEKKLYEEVRAGERVRIAYEKKCKQLRNQDVRGEDPSSVDKTRSAIRDLHTQIKVSLHSVEAISKRIETLRDEELQPQLLELVRGLATMWKVMAECHQLQKRTLDEAKLLLAGAPSKLSGFKKHTIMSPSDQHQLARSAAKLETELRNWRSCFESWIASQRSYVHALASWLLRCIQSDPDISKLPFSPRRSTGTPPIFKVCIHWSRFHGAILEAPVLEGLDFFAAGVGSLYAQQLKEDSRRTPIGSKRFGGRFPVESGGDMAVVEVGRLQEEGEEEEVMTAEKMADVCH